MAHAILFIGGGIVASGACLSDIVSYEKLIINLSYWEKLVISNEINFRTALRISKSDPLLIKLMFDDQECWLYEPIRKVKFQLNCCDNNGIQTDAGCRPRR